MAEPEDFYWMVMRVRYRHEESNPSDEYHWAIDFTAVIPGLTDIAAAADVLRYYALAVMRGTGVVLTSPIVRWNQAVSYWIERPAAEESLEILGTDDALSPGLGVFGGMPAQVALVTWATPNGIGLQARRYIGGLSDAHFNFRRNLWSTGLTNYVRGFWTPRDSPEHPGVIVHPVIWARATHEIADVRRAYFQLRPRTQRRRADGLPKAQVQLLG